MSDPKEKINENDSSVEKLADYIKSSKEMNEEPKKRMSLKAKAILLVTFGIILIVCDIIFIKKPYVFRNEFKVAEYDIYEYNFKALGNKTVIYDSKTIELGENIVNILPYTNYLDLENRYIVMLSEYGHIYLYNLTTNTSKMLENITENISNISMSKLDVYDVVEVTLEDGITKKLLNGENLLSHASKDLKMMDEIIFRYEDYIVYLLNDEMYICDYNKVRHFKLETEDYYGTTMTNPKKIVDSSQNAIKFDQAKVIIHNNSMYIYGVTKNKKLVVYTYNLNEYMSLPENIQTTPIEFTKDILGFSDYKSEYSVRLDIGESDKNIDVFLDKLMIGSMSNDNYVMTYVTDFSDAIGYKNVEDKNGNYRYEGRYYTFEYFDKENNTYTLKCAFLTSYSKLAVVTFKFNEKNEFSYVCEYPELKDNQSIDKIYIENEEVYITIKEVVENDFIVFESTTDTEYKTFLLEDFIN